ncbi:hypothetical protein AA0120_g8807 [Alternaria tenuissima]|nr:hypothetical protein AA0120_g8807 [Alternaria tenuissima]
MAHIEQDSELFINYVSAQAVPAGKRFFAFADELGAPAILSLSSDGVLNIFKQDKGRLDSRDFGALCGVTGTIVALAATQCSDSTVCIAFAARTSHGSQVTILPMIETASLFTPDRNKLVSSVENLPLVHDIAVSDFVDDHGYPPVVVFYQPVERTTKQSDCALVSIVKEGGVPTAQLSKSWSLPVDVQSVLDLAFAKTSVGNGIFVLYKDSTPQQKLVFSTYDGTDFNVLTKCPSDISCITTFTPGKDMTTARTHLVLAGSSIYHLTQKEYLHKDRDGSQASNTLLSGGIKSIQSTVKEDHFSIWFTTQDDAAGYATQAVDSANIKLDVVPLLSSGSGGRLSGMLTATSMRAGKALVNTIVSVDQKDQLTTLQQDSPNGAWDAYPLLVNNPAKTLPVESYTTRIRIMSGINKAASHATFTLKCSGRVSAIVNGFDTPLAEAGQTLSCDAAGEVTFIIAASDVSSHTFELSDIRDKAAQSIKVDSKDRVLHPSSKAMNKLRGIRDAETLKAAKTRDGKPLANMDGLLHDDIEMLGSNIGALADHAQALHESSMVGITNTRLALAITDHAPNEFWHWAIDKVHQAEKWLLDVSGAVATFMVTIAGVAKTFILDSVKAVGKALTWVWTKVKVGFGALIDYLETKDVAEKWFESMKTTLTGVPAPSTTNIDAQQHSTKPTEQTKNAQASMGFNFSKYHLTHGGALEKFLPEIEPEDLALIQNAWTAIKAIIAQGEKDVMKLCSDIAKAFENMDDTVSLLDVVKIVLVDAAVIFLDILKGIVALVLGVLRDVIRWIVANGNKPVEIPIFSSLYRDISGGHALTMFDAVCLVVAIPATVINKVLTGKALPNISNFIDKTSFAAYMNGNLEAKKSLQVSQFSAGAFIGSDAICTLMQVIDVVADGKVNAMAMSERSLLQPELSEMHPQVRAMALKVPDFTKWKCISWVNLVSSGVNVVSGCPARQSYTDTKQHGVDWVRWLISVGRWTASAAGRAADVKANLALASDTKKIINLLQPVAQVITVLMYIDKRVKTNDGKDHGRRDGIVACESSIFRAPASLVLSQYLLIRHIIGSLLNTVSKSGAELTRDEDIKIAAACESIYLVTAFGNSVLQCVNLYDAVKEQKFFNQFGDEGS